MHKMSLLLVALSVCALHAADEKEKEEMLPMESIKEYKELSKYAGKVVAFTSSVRLNGGIAGFTLGQKSDFDYESPRYGILEHFWREQRGPYNCEIYYQMNLQLFTKTFVAGKLILAEVWLKDEGSPFYEGKNEKEEYLRNVDLKIRLATLEEKRELKQAILDGRAMLQNRRSKVFASLYLDKDNSIDYFSK